MLGLTAEKLYQHRAATGDFIVPVREIDCQQPPPEGTQHVLMLIGETGVPGVNPPEHRENMQTPPRKKSWCERKPTESQTFYQKIQLK